MPVNVVNNSKLPLLLTLKSNKKMQKSTLIQEVSKEVSIAQKDVATFLDSLQKTITKTLKKGEDIKIIGFGSFKIIKTAARTGRNPQTGKEIKIKAGKRIKFKVGQGLKDAVNS
jgi:nucleoid DNA-binding protein